MKGVGNEGSMYPRNWSAEETGLAIGAMKFICTERNTVAMQPIHRAFLESMRDFVFRHPDIDIGAVPLVGPADFSRVVSDKSRVERTLEYLTVIPYVQPDICAAQANLVTEYFRATGHSSDALGLMRKIAHRYILSAQLCIARKLVPHLLPGGPVRQLRRAVRMVRQTRGDERIAAPFHALKHLPPGTLGNAFFRFHRNRGFALPGEPGCVPEELASLHDITHILSGYNTDPPGEIFAQAFAGGSMPRHGLMIAITGLLSYHNGIVFDAGGGRGLTRNALEPFGFWRAFARGMDSVCLIYGWDYKQDWETPVSDLRERFRIQDAADVWDDPPADQARQASEAG
jgi:hypothetical protein